MNFTKNMDTQRNRGILMTLLDQEVQKQEPKGKKIVLFLLIISIILLILVISMMILIGRKSK